MIEITDNLRIEFDQKLEKAGGAEAMNEELQDLKMVLARVIEEESTALSRE